MTPSHRKNLHRGEPQRDSMISNVFSNLTEPMKWQIQNESSSPPFLCSPFSPCPTRALPQWQHMLLGTTASSPFWAIIQANSDNQNHADNRSTSTASAITYMSSSWDRHNLCVYNTSPMRKIKHSQGPPTQRKAWRCAFGSVKRRRRIPDCCSYLCHWFCLL